MCNLALKDILAEREYDLTALNKVIYSTAKAVTTQVGVKMNRKRATHVNKLPKWKVKMQKVIEVIRAEILILNEISTGVNMKTRMPRNIKMKYKFSDKNALSIAKESLKMRMQVKAQK